MAVYTDVPDDELQKFAAQYTIGEVISCKGIAEGVEKFNQPKERLMAVRRS